MTDNPLSRYALFISYSHKDEKVARWLHSTIENYRLPKLIGTERSAALPDRIGRVFRDEEELAGSSELGPSINTALELSDALLVVCTPAAASSVWVEREIIAFKRLHPSAKVLAVIADGEPNSATRECFSRALKYRVTSGGELDPALPMEPLAPDLQKQDRTTVKLKILAALFDVPFDSLLGRERRRSRRRLIAAGVTAASIILALVLLSVSALGNARIATLQRDRAERANLVAQREARIAQSNEIVAQAARQVASLRAKEAAMSAAEANRQASLQQVAAAAALRAQFDAETHEAEALATQVLAALARGDSATATDLAVRIKALKPAARSAPEIELALSRASTLGLERVILPSGRNAVSFVPSDNNEMLFQDDHDALYGLATGTVAARKFNTAPTKVLLVRQEKLGEVAYCATGERWLLDLPAAKTLTPWSGKGVTALAVSKDGSVLGFTSEGELYRASGATDGKALSASGLGLSANPVTELLIAPNQKIAFGKRRSGSLFLLDLGTGKAVPAPDFLDPRFSHCIRESSNALALCLDKNGSLAWVDVDGTVESAEQASLHRIRALQWLADAFVIQRQDGSVAFGRSRFKNATGDPSAKEQVKSKQKIVRRAALTELGSFNSDLVQLYLLEPTVALAIFSDGQVTAIDPESRKPYFSYDIGTGVVDARIDFAARKLLLIDVEGNIRRLDLSAVWFNDWVSNDITPSTFHSYVDNGNAFSTKLLEPTVVPKAKRKKLIWADGALQLDISSYLDGEEVLTFKDVAVKFPVEAQNVFSSAGASNDEIILVADNILWLMKLKKGVSTARYTSLEGIAPYNIVKGDNGSIAVLGHHGSLIVSKDRKTLLKEPWPFLSVPSQLTLDYKHSLAALLDMEGRVQINHLSTGSELARAFGSPDHVRNALFEGNFLKVYGERNGSNVRVAAP